MDFLVGRVRSIAYDSILKAYAPNLSISFLSKELGFNHSSPDESEDEKEDEEDVEDLRDVLTFIRANHGVLVENDTCIDTKQSRVNRQQNI